MPPSLRLAVPDDAEQVRAIYASYFHTPITFELEAPSVDEMRRRMAKIMERDPWIVCQDEEEILGYAYAGPHGERPAYRWSVNTSVYIGRHRRRQGVGRALYTALLHMLPLQGYVSAYAGATIPNASSVGLHEAMGFERVGVYRSAGYKGGVWHDVAWFQRALQSPPSNPAEPKPLDEVRSMTEWTAALEAGQSSLRGRHEATT